jgi:putative transposase
MIETCCRGLKRNRLFLHPLDSAAKVRSLVEFYVAEHNERIPRAAFHGQTPDEMFFGTGGHVPVARGLARESARRTLLRGQPSGALRRLRQTWIQVGA